MADLKRKLLSERAHKRFSCTKRRKQDNIKHKKGLRLPSKLKKQIDLWKPESSDEGHGGDFEVRSDVYEYEEDVPDEKSKKNHRFDAIENLEYELPRQFEDEDVESDVDWHENVRKMDSNDDDSDDFGYDAEGNNGERHNKMLEGITGLPNNAFEGMNLNDVIMCEPYPESEYNPSRNVLDGAGRISIHDLLDPLHGKSGYSKLRKRIQQIEKKSGPVEAPLPKADRERLERRAAYEHSKKDITKWEPLIKCNREASTIYFDENTDVGFSTIGAIASSFEPVTDFEKKMASLVHNSTLTEAHYNDGAQLLQLNMLSAEDVLDRQNHLSRMRSLLFRHEMKAKRIKKIKSKTFHRLLKKDRLRGASDELYLDPEVAKELAMKREFKRAEERMTQRHKNSSRWAKRILKRGLSAQDEGTRAAISEQLHEHAHLTRKMDSMKGSGSSSDEGSSDDGDFSDDEEASKLLAKAKEKTLKVIHNEDEEVPKTGVLALPFMVRGLKKREEETCKEAKHALEDYESSLNKLDGKSWSGSPKTSNPSGRRFFGITNNEMDKRSCKNELNKSGTNSESEDECMDKDDGDATLKCSSYVSKDVSVDPDMFQEDSEDGHDHVLKTYEDVAKASGPTTTYEVALFVSDSWKKMDNAKISDVDSGRSEVIPDQDLVKKQTDIEVESEGASESEGEMVDGILTVEKTSGYKLPSQAELVRRAFTGDNVEEEFEKEKQETVSKENPEPEKPILLPGWGQWTEVQQKKGLPAWMVKEHEEAKRKREEALKERKDAHLKHVIVSERLGRKAERLHTRALPYPFTSKEVFEQSIRMPIGPEYNPTTAVSALNRPEVVKKAGVIIKPIKFKEVDPHGRSTEQKTSKRKAPKNSSTRVGSRPKKG